MLTQEQRELMIDSIGRPYTQSLFLELKYEDNAFYSLKSQDWTHKGKLYPSIRRLYLECEDPTEYTFANKYFLGWDHWMRLTENKAIRVHIDAWRNELEIKLRAKGVLEMIKSANKGNFQAAKYLADRGWDTRGAGRPSKDELTRRAKIAETVHNEYAVDIARLRAV